MPVDESGMAAAFDTLDALAASAPMTAGDYNLERAKIIADGIKTGTVIPDVPPSLTPMLDGAGLPVNGTGHIE